MLQNTIFLRGPEAAELFYDENRFIRQGAAPLMLKKTLFGFGAIQNMNDAEHKHRKAMFMSLMTPEQIQHLKELTAEQWQMAATRWSRVEQVVLYDELHEILGRAVCAWAGVPLSTEQEAAQHIHDLRALFDYAGAIGPGHYESRSARRRLQSWLEEIITQIRDGQLSISEESPASVIAWHRDLEGQLLSPRLAAVELLNVLRPVVAISVFIVQSAHALHLYPECKQKLEADQEYMELFVQEVRRFYPFFPATVAKVRQDFEWNGFNFRTGTRAMLDLYGTNHDRRTWDEPEEFCPERFLDWDQNIFNFIPQGGGEHHQTHRCPGEWITVELMKQALDFLMNNLQYDVPAQNLQINRSRLPGLPHSFFIIRDIRIKNTVFLPKEYPRTT